MAVNWTKIRNEYATSNVSLRKLADKHNVSLAQIAKKSKEEKWPELREQKQNKIRTKTEQKTIEKIAENQANETVDALNFMSELLAGLKAEYQATTPGSGKKIQSKKDGDTLQRVEKESSIKILSEIAKATAIILDSQKRYGNPSDDSEDSGLKAALYANVEELFADGDDSDMIPEEDESDG